VDTLSYKTKTAKPKDIVRAWHIVDMENQVLGRACSSIATLLRGKHKPSYTPNIDTGDYVIVINSAKFKLTGKKMEEKQYVTYSGYPGGQKKSTPSDKLAYKPNYVVENAVRGMLPKTKLGRAMFGKLFVYEGTDHPHAAQKPQAFKLDK